MSEPSIDYAGTAEEELGTPEEQLSRCLTRHDALTEQYEELERQCEALKLMYQHAIAERNALMSAISRLMGGPGPIGEYGKSTYGNAQFG